MTERIKVPGFSCPTCGQTDWNWNKNMERWECRSCVVHGRPEPPKPQWQPISVDEWVSESFENYDKAYEIFNREKSVEEDGQAISIVKVGRISRAERQLKFADVQANVANLVLELQKQTKTADIYLDLPEIELKVRLQW